MSRFALNHIREQKVRVISGVAACHVRIRFDSSACKPLPSHVLLHVPLLARPAARPPIHTTPTTQLRDPHAVMEHASKLGFPARASLSSEEDLAIVEQMVMAACDVGDMETAEKCVSMLKKRFPDSVRVLRLRGLILEASAGYEEANEIYDEMLKRNPANLYALKRKVSDFVCGRHNSIASSRQLTVSPTPKRMPFLRALFSTASKRRRTLPPPCPPSSSTSTTTPRTPRAGTPSLPFTSP